MKLRRTQSLEPIRTQLRELIGEGDPGALPAVQEAAARFPDDGEIRLIHAVGLAALDAAAARAETLAGAELLLAAAEPRRRALADAAHQLLAWDQLEPARRCADAADAAPLEHALIEAVVVPALATVRGALAVRDGDLVAAEPQLHAAYVGDPTDNSAGEYAALLANTSRPQEALEVLDEAISRPVQHPRSSDVTRKALLELRSAVIANHGSATCGE